MAILDFLLAGKRKVKVAYMNHGTEHGQEALAFITDYCAKHELELTVGSLTRDKEDRESPEEFWREERYRFLHSLPLPVVTAHHLDDVIEQWIFTALNGKPRIIPVQKNNVLRPFMATKKSELLSWCSRRQVPYVSDPSNVNLRFARNRIRHNIVPEALLVNMGLHKVLRRMVEDAYVEYKL